MQRIEKADVRTHLWLGFSLNLQLPESVLIVTQLQFAQNQIVTQLGFAENQIVGILGVDSPFF